MRSFISFKWFARWKKSPWNTSINLLILSDSISITKDSGPAVCVALIIRSLKIWEHFRCLLPGLNLYLDRKCARYTKVMLACVHYLLFRRLRGRPITPLTERLICLGCVILLSDHLKYVAFLLRSRRKLVRMEPLCYDLCTVGKSTAGVSFS